MMDKQKVAVLGASGMLGSMVLDVLAKDSNLDVSAVIRNKELVKPKEYPSVAWQIFDVENANVAEMADLLAGINWVINCIGITKPHIDENDAAKIERAIRVNSLYPHNLAKAAGNTGVKVLQIATDCVYSGEKGDYIESDLHDALDVYGKTKSLGEVVSSNVHHLRCSIIGPEPKSHHFFLDWFVTQSKGATVSGYTNHQWNGITTLHFAKICQGIIANNQQLPKLQHVIPGDRLAKSDILKLFAKAYKREDITINPAAAPKVIDRTLKTSDEATNLTLWQNAGYKTIPTLEEMIMELAKYKLS